MKDRLVAQFHVYRLPDGMLVLDLQSDLVDTGGQVVAPLLAVSDGVRTLARLEPVFEIDGSVVALHSGELAALPARLLAGPPVADLTAQDRAIRGALGMLFSGL